MASFNALRFASRRQPANLQVNAYPVLRQLPLLVNRPSRIGCDAGFSTSATRSKKVVEMGHEEETFEEFSTRYEKEFESVQDVFDLQRNLNNAFAYDLVPSPSVITAALRAARRVNDYPTAVRIFEGIKAKVENKGQYDEYLRDLQSLREELGVNLREELYPEMIYPPERDD